MPREDRESTYKVPLEHDIEAHINQIKKVLPVGMLEGNLKRLLLWPEGTLAVTANADVISTNMIFSRSIKARCRVRPL
jgi:hypothetical protein